MSVIPVLLLLGSLYLCGPVEASSTVEMLKVAALKLQQPVTCDQWDCNCAFKRQRGCCCAAEELYQLEEDYFVRFIDLWHDVHILQERVEGYSASVKIGFTATMNSNLAIANPGSDQRCFGPFNTNVPMPFGTILLNDGNAFNPTLGTFTAPAPGIYVFSFTTYSYVGRDERIYHKVQLMLNGEVVVSLWEDNREDGEDSGTQLVTVRMARGDQVYLELMTGRKICNRLQHNVFTGYILYPSSE